MEASWVLLAAAVAGLAFGAVAASGRKGIFWLAFGATLVPLEFVDRYYVPLPSGIKWLPELAVLGAGLAAWILCPRERRVPRSLWVITAATLVAAAVSMAVNRTPLVNLLLAQRWVVLLFGSLLALQAVRGTYARERVLALLLGAGVVSAAVCVLQRLTVAAQEGDRVTGLFSFGEVVLFVHLACIALALAGWLEGRRIGRWNPAFVVGLLTLSLAIGNQEAALPLLALVLATLWIRARRRRLALLAVGLALSGATLLLFSAIYDRAYPSEGGGSFTASIFDPEYVRRYVFGRGDDVQTPSGDLLRGAAVVTAYREISADGRHLLLGRGPGATTESGAGGELARRFPGIGRVTLALLLGDSGLLGVVLHLGLLLAILWPRAGAAEPREMRLFREVVVLLALANLAYARLPYEPIAAWILACALDPGAPPSSPPSGGSRPRTGTGRRASELDRARGPSS
jgi:hypothetical protein